MPEPSVEKEKEDFYDRDVEDPFSVGSGHATPLQKLRFLSWPVFLMMVSLRPWTTNFIGLSDAALRYWFPLGCTHLLGTAPPLGAFALVKVYKCCRVAMGLQPGAFNWRIVIHLCLNSNCWLVCSMCRHTFLSLGHDFSAQIELDQTTEDGLRLMSFSLFMSGFGMVAPRSFMDYSPWGVYCCANFPGIRQMKNFGLTLFFVLEDYYVKRNLYIASITPGALGSVLAPVGVFGWKRALYFMDVSVCLHDTPFKGQAFVIGILHSLMAFNLGLSLAVVGVAQWIDAINYICIDWAIYLARIAIVTRAGIGICPKLVTYIVKKNIENIPAPLPNHVRAVGDKTSMRVTQAYLCLSEGEGMTVMFFMLVVDFIICWPLWRDPMILFIFPMRSFFVVGMYMGLDLIQDFLADGLTKKFNDWSWLYQTTGWFGKRFQLQQLLMSYALANEAACYLGTKQRYVMHNLMRFPIWDGWHASSNVLLHY